MKTAAPCREKFAYSRDPPSLLQAHTRSHMDANVTGIYRNTRQLQPVKTGSFLIFIFELPLNRSLLANFLCSFANNKVEGKIKTLLKGVKRVGYFA